MAILVDLLECEKRHVGGSFIPVDGGNDGVQSKSRVVGMVLTPDRSLVGLVIVGSVEGVVDAGDHRQQVGNDGQDLVGGNGSGVVGVSLGEGVDW